MNHAEFDYVVVGGGSAGCVLAGRLSEDGKASVCLLEAGGQGNSPLVRMPVGVIAMMRSTLNNWAFGTVPQAGLDGRIGYQPRGKALGGSSAINAMVYIRGTASDYDGWAALGNEGWSYRDVLPYFRRAEHNEQFDDAFHGKGGPLNVAGSRTGNPFHQYFIDAGLQAGYKYCPDFNGADQDGFGPIQVTQKNGERCSAARAYVLPHIGKRSNLDVRTGVQATRVLFDGTRAVGVEYRQDGKTVRVLARREVILSAGALQSPQLLMLSGVGPAEHLARHGIPVLHDLPGVGANLQDHLDFLFVYKSRSLHLFGFSLGGALRVAMEAVRYLFTKRGMLASNFAEVGCFIKTDPALADPDIQGGFVVAQVDDHGRKLDVGHGYATHVILLRPKSAGTLRLANADPLQPPLIDPAFLQHPDDVETMVKGFKAIRHVNSQKPLADQRYKELYTANVHTDDDIRAVLRRRADSVYHPTSTCKMGPDSDPLAVVDSQLRVKGVQGLRVADASIMPNIVGGNTNAPCIMIGEKAADMIRAAWAA